MHEFIGYLVEHPDVQAAWLPWAIMGGAALLQGLFGNRSQSRAHERQLASEDRRHDASIAATDRDRRERSADYRYYVQRDEALKRADRERRAGALSGLSGGLHGLPAGFDLGQLAQTGGVAPPMPAGGAGAASPIPVQSGGMPQFETGGGIAQALSLIQQFAPYLNQPTAALPASRIPGAETGMLFSAPALPAGMGGHPNIGGSNLVR